MVINRLLQEKGMTKYRLSKSSGVPMTTITDLCSGKTSIEKCAAGTLYRIAKALGVTMEYLLEEEGFNPYSEEEQIAIDENLEKSGKISEEEEESGREYRMVPIGADPFDEGNDADGTATKHSEEPERRRVRRSY